MILQDMMNSITTIGAQIRAKSQAMADAAMAGATSESLQAMRDEIAQLKDQKAALQQSYEIEKEAQAGIVSAAGQRAEQPRSRRERLASNEYARAFAWAVKNGIGPRNAAGHPEAKILMDALTETGGNPAGTDGGFLVPEDIDHSIREKRRELSPLADLFSEETVTAPTGWRVTDTAPTTGMTLVNEMGTIPTDDQPAFSKVTYSCSKYALILPVSNELLQDEDANLFDYIGRWYAKKLVITENNLLIAALRTLTATSVTATKELNALKTAKNVTLDPAISDLSTWIMNQTAFDVLDQLLDNDDRPLLRPDPTTATLMRLLGLGVRKVSNAMMGAPATNKSDIFLGYGKEFATLFRVQGFQLDSTGVGGNAWRTDSTELRGITRLGVTKFDADAMVRLQLTTGS